MSDLHPAAPDHLPGFITAPGDTDTLMVVVGIILIGAVLMVGIFYLHLWRFERHTKREKRGMLVFNRLIDGEWISDV